MSSLKNKFCQLRHREFSVFARQFFFADHANILVYPCLEVGNISYKMVQRLGNAIAIGPILQGIARPVNDLSRGCSVDDVYYMIAITANQATFAKENSHVKLSTK